jgi:hypothetical protein
MNMDTDEDSSSAGHPESPVLEEFLQVKWTPSNRKHLIAQGLTGKQAGVKIHESTMQLLTSLSADFATELLHRANHLATLELKNQAKKVRTFKGVSVITDRHIEEALTSTNYSFLQQSSSSSSSPKSARTPLHPALTVSVHPLLLEDY